MKKFLINGTSHTKSNLEWPNYLADLLGYEFVNYGIGAYGSDTYSGRVVSAPKCDVALLEIPSDGRYTPMWGDSEPGDTLDTNFWQQPRQREQVIYHLTDGDINEDQTKLDKYTRLNSNRSEFKITQKNIEQYLETKVLDNRTAAKDKIMADCLVADAYLKQQGTQVFWFSWNFPVDDYQEYVEKLDFIKPGKNSMFREYVLGEQKWDKKQVFYDGTHLSAKYWKLLVDQIIYPYILGAIND